MRWWQFDERALARMKFSLIAVFTFFLLLPSGKAESVSASYAAKCQMCHGATGLGDTPAGKAMGATAFNTPDVVKLSDADLLAAIENGKAKMPAFTGKLTVPQMTALVTYIRRLK